MSGKSRAEWLIEKLMASPKLASSGNFSSKIYRDEPIVMTGRQYANAAPTKIREMRRLDRGNWPVERLFYEQGKFMETFEDNFEYLGEFKQYYPTYQLMSDLQLRGYFTWRTLVRKGLIEKTSLSFAFVYIYELLNQIGVATPEEGYTALKEFWTAYSILDARIDSYLQMWLKDYVIYYNLDQMYLEGLPDINTDQALATLLDNGSREAGDIFTALNSLSSYKIGDSKFFREHGEEVRTAVVKAYFVTMDHYNRLPGKDARERLFGRLSQTPYHIFKSAVFHPRSQAEERVYQIGPYHKYFYKHGAWSSERFVWYGNDNKQIGELLRSVDFIMRQKLDFKSNLRDGTIPKRLRTKIEREIDAYLEELRRNAPVKIDIDVSKLREIRETARATQEKLLLEESGAESPRETTHPPEPTLEPGMPGGIAAVNGGPGLAATETCFLKCLLDNTSYAGLLKEKGLMLSVLVDGINAKLFPLLNDTAIVYDNDRPQVLADYAEELLRILPP